ncbi:DUF3307 domain-containing protein [Roseivivax isoporae]|uniref:DUF3307 domain-containing protein n=1 Tax=Roseivivax isoporae LMG 25204 TaxID=1449351 RepID=X7F324_9RHOB|nr:DUF3307 domain-containing protein [Roseivivax isoporae]ETX27200.1 hypothetical protein RISW2_15195 [Roseivivax isoporae LMG 25204]
MTGAAETFAVLLLAHALADFVFQTDAMVKRKDRIATQGLHAAMVLAASFAAIAAPTWQAALAALAIAVSHAVTDRIKRMRADTLLPFCLDQLAHLAVLGVVALTLPGLWHASAWQMLPAPVAASLPVLCALAAGLIVTVRAGGFAVEKLLAPMRAHAVRRAVLSGSLPNAGARIGALERLLTFILVLAGQPTGVAFLIAAKSILRFDATRGDRAMGEYVIVGTLGSVAWALAGSYATAALIGRLGGLP